MRRGASAVPTSDFGPERPLRLLRSLQILQAAVGEAGRWPGPCSPAHARGRPPRRATRSSSTPASRATAWATANGACAHGPNHPPAAALVVRFDDVPGGPSAGGSGVRSQAPFAVAQAVSRRRGVDEVMRAGLGGRPRAWAGERTPGPRAARRTSHENPMSALGRKRSFVGMSFYASRFVRSAVEPLT
jgi:hypothetical protein